ncbi:hypothetical protein BGZ63DRAFT_397537, partial [Mariannaea sp. PMI_226]
GSDNWGAISLGIQIRAPTIPEVHQLPYGIGVCAWLADILCLLGSFITGTQIIQGIIILNCPNYIPKL